MDNYIQFEIEVAEPSQRDILIAQLCACGAEGFEEAGEKLVVFFREAQYNSSEVDNVLLQGRWQYHQQLVEPQNWNALWESNFEPVMVDDFCYIRADFHPPAANVPYEVVITPKMSFGTGHHATTWMMVQQMRHLQLLNKTVADFGTGTGVLAIMAEKLGAARVWAIDNEENAIENAAENLARNGCSHIELALKTEFSCNGTFEVILANINKNVILDNVKRLSNGLAADGQLLLSGLLETDEEDVKKAFVHNGLQWVHTIRRDKWIAMLLGKASHNGHL